jgi:thiol-disulfide isomerase/thioredoxin
MDLYCRSPRRFVAVTVLLWGLLLALPWGGGANAQGAADIDWVTGKETGEPRVHLYFFWSRSCPHCREALPFVHAMASEYDWLALHAHEPK